MAAPPKVSLVNPFEYLNSGADPNSQKAYTAYQKGDYAESRSQLKNILHENPEHYPSLLLLGYTYLAEEHPDLAERYIRRALEISPDYAQAHYALALVMEQKNDYPGALAELNEVARLNPDYPGIQQNMNILKLKATEQYLTKARSVAESNPEEAIRYYQAASALAPEITQIPLEIAQMYLKLKNCPQALDSLKKSGEQLPDELDSQLAYADCLSQDEQYVQALAIYQKLAQAHPQNAEIQSKKDEVARKIAFRNMPQEYQAISSTEQISRAQLAALLVNSLGFLQKYTSQRPQIITDTLNHWAHTYIRKVVDLGMMDLFPNRTFQPNRSITKLELARAASRILEILEMNEGKTLPAAGREPVVIPDVAMESVYYSMISKALTAQVISLDADGRFHGNRPVSGAEALSVVNRLKSLSGEK